MIGALVAGSFLIRWLGRRALPQSAKNWFEWVLASGSLVGIDILIFWTTIGKVSGVPLVYFILVSFVWVGLRMGLAGTTLGILVTSALGTAAVVGGHGSFAEVELGVALFSLQIFLVFISSLFLVFASVVAERKEAVKILENQIHNLEETLDKTEAADRAKNEFIAILAHELRNPLAPLMSSIELLKLQDCSEPWVKESLDVMDNQISKMKRLLDDLLDISRITQKKIALHKKIVDLSSIVNASVQSVKILLEKKNQAISIDLPKEDIIFEIDPVRVEQAVINLLNNASKFSEEGERIFLSASYVGKMMDLRVKDNGVGIDPHLLSRVFEPFLQAIPHEDYKHNDGLGIGLALSKTLIEMHGGTIGVISKGKNRGSEFFIRLPIFSIEEGETPVSIEEEKIETFALPKAGKYRVLVVDDNTAAAKGIATLLTLKGYLTDIAYSGVEAKEKTKSFEPHVLILDIGLPDINGYEVARQIQAETDFTGSLIALTGYGQNEDKQKALDAGFDYHFTKPVGIADLELALGEIFVAHN